MGKFNKGGFGGGFRGRGGFGGGRGGFGGRDRGRPDMHSATCSECGRECEVPFRPTGDKPVYCNDCFKNQGGGRDRGGFGGDRDRGRGRGGFGEGGDRDRGGRGDFGEKRMHNAICAECGEECEVPFKPTGNKEVYCAKCFGREGDFKQPKRTNEYRQEFDKINSKLDRILKAMESAGLKKEDAIVKPVTEVEKFVEVKKDGTKEISKAKKIPAKKKIEKPAKKTAKSNKNVAKKAK